MRTKNTTSPIRAAGACVGALILIAVATTAANAADAVGEDGSVDVTVTIPELTEPGVLAMSVSGTSAALSESDSGDPLVREFTGQLPTVTVTDTRASDEIPVGAAWYVLGTSSDFIGDAGQAPIDAGHLGWAPRLVEGGESGLVAEGQPVGTVMDAGADAVGLVDQELLAGAWDSGEVATEGSWTATADLFLRTDTTVAPGDYAATVTLSLFE